MRLLSFAIVEISRMAIYGWNISIHGFTMRRNFRWKKDF